MLARARFCALAAALLAGAIVGCGDDAAPVPDAAIADPRPTGYLPNRVGVIHLLSGPAGQVDAELHDRPDPLAPVLRHQLGSCDLYLQPVAEDCGPCDGVCVSVDECAARPRPASAGPISVTGLRRGLVFRPGPLGYDADSEPSKDLFEVGAHIRVVASGDQVPGFSADLTGVPPLEVGFAELVLARGRDTRLIWTAAGVGRVAVTVVTRPVGGAGFSSMLRCEADDFGTMTLGADIAARLPEPRADEEQLATVSRLHRTVLPLAAGPVELLVGSQLEVPLRRGAGPR
jgi:hypothetical protein